MSRIGAILSGTERTLLNRLAEANAAATLGSLRMASQQRVTAPGDDPSAFLALSRLQSRLSTVRATMNNVTAASSMATQTQTTLADVRTQLDLIRTELLTDENGGLTSSQRAQAQANIDAAVQQINTLASAEIDGRRLLDGSADFNVTGRNSTQVAGVTVYSMTGSSSQTISGTVTTAATQAELTYTGKAGALVEFNATFTLTGKRGSVAITVTADESLSDAAQRINDQSHNTGLTASVSGNDIKLTSVDYGSGATAKVAVSTGTFDVTGGDADGIARGTDVVAKINGRTDTNADGNQLTLSANGFRFEIEFAPGFTGDIDALTVSGNALSFALSPDLSHRATLALPGLQSNRLGGPSGSLDQLVSGAGLAGLSNNTSQAIRVVDEALGKLDRAEGTVDGFYNSAVSSSSGLMADLEQDLLDAIAQTDGYNQQEETVLLAKNQQLASNALAGLAILDDQRSSMVLLLQRIAGLT